MGRELPASVGQRLLWVLDHYRGDDGALNCPVLFRVRGPLDRDRLNAAVNALTQRHESLRTTFEGRGSRLLQLVHETQTLSIKQVDLSDSVCPTVRAQQAIDGELTTSIDPRVWPVRVTLWRLGEQDHILCINVHHLVTDAWSGVRIFRELQLLLNGATVHSLPAIRWQYAQFTEWQYKSFQEHMFGEQQAYWQRKLLGAECPELPFKPRAAQGSDVRRTASEISTIDADSVESLRQLARKHRTTFFTVMLAAFYGTLHRVTGQTDLAVGSIFANRFRPEVSNTIGFFANMLVLRNRFPMHPNFLEILENTRNTVQEAFLHQALPYQLLPANTIQAGPRRPDDVVFQLLSEPMNATNIRDARVEMLLPASLSRRFDLELTLVPRDGALNLALYYNAARLDRDRVAAFLEEYASFIVAIGGGPRRRASDKA